jgi:hypothetical protein
MKTSACPFIEDYMIENKLFVDDGEIKIRKGKNIKTVEILDDRRFVKVYIQSDDVLSGLKNSTQIIFEYIFRMLQSSEAYNTMEIEFSYKDYLIFKKRRGIEKGVSEKSFYNARAELIKNKIIALKNGTTYWYNFNYFFNGDRFSVVKEYVLGETKNSVEVKALEVPKIATGTKGVSPLQRLNFDSKGEEVKNDYYESLTEDDCSKVPVKELNSLNKDEYPKHSPIWWAIISAQSKNKKYTHTS